MRLSNHRIVDTHAHLCDPVFDTDRSAVIKRARAAGVGAIITVSEDLSDAKRNIELNENHPELKPAAGLYPTCLDLKKAQEMSAFIRSERNKLVAIGEVGLDYWIIKEKFQKEIQQEIFVSFIHLAMEFDLPLNVHSRSAGHHAIALLLEHNANKVQLHAFDGKTSTALPAVEAGFFFSIPPSIVRSRQKQKLVKRLPLSCLLVETDSPVLGPLPDKRNEPVNAIVSLNAIADIKNISKDEVMEAVIDNTHRLFGDITL
jgi:TatD DNase family protein